MQIAVSADVRTADFCAIFNKTYAEIVRLKLVFLRPHLTRRGLDEPTRYGPYVKAFCVLAHAALEQCFEDIALATTINRTDHFRNGGDVSRTLLMLMLYHGRTEALPSDEADVSIRTFDVLRTSLEEAHRKFSIAVSENHGIFFTHLASLLSPAGIDVQLEPDEKDAIKLLKQARGEHAHTYVTRVIVSPEDALRYVYRILSVARRIARKGAGICGQPSDAFRHFRIPT